MPANQPTKLQYGVTLEPLELNQAIKVLINRTADFIKDKDGHPVLWAASRDWFLEEWGRDTFISLPGLLITTERFEDARAILRRFAEMEKNGIIPNRINENETVYNNSDGSLWFIRALRLYVDATNDWTFGLELLPTVKGIILNYAHGTKYDHFGAPQRIYAADDGLMVTPAQSTWMDADPSGAGNDIITPRNGKCVEVNALWYSAINYLLDLLERSGEFDDALYDRLDSLQKDVHANFAVKFWNENQGCLRDVIDGDPHGDAIRPNQIIAISDGLDLLSEHQIISILNVVSEQLLTPAGLRTLAPTDSEYKGSYDTYAPMSVKDQAYHQGTVWPWLIAFYLDACFVSGNHQKDISSFALETLSPLLRFVLDSKYNSLPEVFSGDEPHEPGGTTSQAWSVAEVLRATTAYIR